MPVPQVFEFSDYRAFLKEWLRSEKVRNPAMSLQVFSNRAGFRSKSHVLLVTQGQRNLSPAAAASIAKACGLKERAAEYFDCLVRYNQSSDLSHKGILFEQLLRLQPISGSVPGRQGAEEDLFQRWYFPALRFIAVRTEYQGNHQKIAQAFHPPLQLRQVDEGIAHLCHCGYLVSVDGGYRLGKGAVAESANGPSGVIRDYQKKVAEAGIRKLEEINASSHMATVTFSAPAERREEIQKRLEQFAAEFSHDYQENQGVVWQVSLQVFPVAGTQHT